MMARSGCFVFAPLGRPRPSGGWPRRDSIDTSSQAFRLTGRTHASRQLRHLIREQVTGALDSLESPEPSEAIHEARKCVKRARAILHLLKEEPGSAFRRENDRLRAAAHSLSALRDADVNGETLRELQRRLTLLRRTILASTESYGDARATALVLGCITRNQATLRSRALDLGARLFSESPAHFDKVVRGWWMPV